MSRLSDLVPADAIALDAPAADWREAIRTAGALLTASGATQDAYTDAMIAAVEEHGPYIVIAPGFALAHARPDASVSRTGMSFVRLAQPVPFGNEANDPVTLVMGLAAADSSAHQEALASLAGVLADPERRAALDAAGTPDEVRAALDATASPHPRHSSGPAVSSQDSSPAASAAPAAATPGTPLAVEGPATTDTAEIDPDAVPSKNLILTVCGNGLGTSLFLKNTAEQVLDRWGWSPYLTVEATDTISAKGRAKDADFLLTSGAIAQTLGDVGVPVEVIENFTSQAEIDAALRRLYAV